MYVRRQIAKAFINRGHEVVLVEDDPDRPDEDYIQQLPARKNQLNPCSDVMVSV